MVVGNLSSFHRANHWSERLSSTLEETALLRLPLDLPRVFFDAGVGPGFVGLGALALDTQGRFHKAIAKRLPLVGDALLAEAYASREACELAGMMQVRHILVGDCLPLIQMIRGDIPCTMEVVTVIEDIRSKLTAHGLDSPFWVPRLENYSAHLLAFFDKSSVSLLNGLFSPPTFLVSNSGRFPRPTMEGSPEFGHPFTVSIPLTRV